VSIHFLVTSAIKSDFGIFSYQDRYRQTADTINSIRKYVPDSFISLIELSVNPIGEYYDLVEPLIDEFINYNANTIVQQIPIKWNNQHSAKSLTETYVLGNLLETFTTTKDRVYKLSGRYCLTEDFILTEQMADPNQFVFKDKWDNNWPKDFTDIHFQYPTYGFSFPSSQINFMSEVFKKSHELILEHVNTGRYCDVEHAMYNFIPEDKVKLINKNAVVGLVAQPEQSN